MWMPCRRSFPDYNSPDPAVPSQFSGLQCPDHAVPSHCLQRWWSVWVLVVVVAVVWWWRWRLWRKQPWRRLWHNSAAQQSRLCPFCIALAAGRAPLRCGAEGARRAAPRRAAPPQGERGEAGHGAPACYAGGKLRAEPRLRPICAE
eukprot:gene16124-biopygen6736